MTGFGFDMSKAEMIKRERKQRAYNYLCAVGLGEGRVPCRLEGNYLIFKYTVQTTKGMQNFERKVDLTTMKFKDRLLRGYEYTGVMYNIYMQQFIPY